MSNLAVNAKIGDGHLVMKVVTEKTNASAMFNSSNIQWLTFKRDLALKEGYKPNEITPSYSGYSNKWNQVKFATRVDKRLAEMYHKPLEEVLANLSKLDLIIWYIDDGSWHKRARTMHLYCNTLNDKQLEILRSRIDKLYGYRPKVNYDTKKDGRSYPYLYFPRPLTNNFWRDTRRFIKMLNLDTLSYKVGETSTTIRNGVAFKRGRKGELPFTAEDIV